MRASSRILSPSRATILARIGGRFGRHLAAAVFLVPVTTVRPAPPASPVSDPTSYRALVSEPRAYSTVELMELARASSPAVRQWAVTRLAESDPLPPAVLDQLANFLADVDDSVRFQTFAGLLRRGPLVTATVAQWLSRTNAVHPFGFFSVRYNGTTTVTTSASDLAYSLLRAIKTPDVDALLDAYRAARSLETSPSLKPETNPLPTSPTPTQGTPQPDLAISPNHADELPAAPQGSTVSRGSGGFDEDPVPSTTARLRLLLSRSQATPTAHLLQALRDGDPELQIALARLCANSGSRAEAAVPALSALAELDQEQVRQTAMLALARIPQSGPPALATLADRGEPTTRADAILFIAKTAASAVVTARALADPEAQVRSSALRRIAHPLMRHEVYGTDEVFLSEARQAAHQRWLLEFPTNTMATLLKLTRSDHAPEEQHAEAVGALVLWGMAHPEARGPVWDTLVAGLTHSVAIAAVCARGLRELADQGALPDQASGSLPKVLAGLVRPDLAESHRHLFRLAAMLMPTDKNSTSLLAKTILQLPTQGLDLWNFTFTPFPRLPELAPALVQEIQRRYPDPLSMDATALGWVWWLANHTAIDARVYHALLRHPDAAVRKQAARRLVEDGDHSPAALQILKELRASKSRLGSDHRIEIDTPRDGGDDWADLVTSIVDDPALEATARGAFLARSLDRLTNIPPQSASLILKWAAPPTPPEIRRPAVRAIAELDLDPSRSEPLLLAAFEDPSPDLRAAAVRAWAKRSTLPAELPERALQDREPEVREAALRLLKKLALGDPRRARLLLQALMDPDEGVQRAALRTAEDLPADASGPLTAYLDRGLPISYPFFNALATLRPLDRGLIDALRRRRNSAPPELQEQIEQALWSAREPPDAERQRQLRSWLVSEDMDLRSGAARQLVGERADFWNDHALREALTAAQVRIRIEETLGAGLDELYPPKTQLVSATFANLPDFPWPPPAGFTRCVIPPQLLGNPAPTDLGTVYSNLVTAITSASPGFVYGLYKGVPGGFALVARMERIRPDGTPLPEPARWLSEGTPVFSLVDLLADLFFEAPGYFRVIVFAVTNETLPPGNPKATLPDAENGSPSIPADLARLPFVDHEVLALVYSFERRPNAEISPWTSGPLTAQQHLSKAGVIRGL